MKSNLKEFYERKAHSYSEVDRLGTERYKYALKELTLKDGVKIVDLGCKNGTLLNLLREMGLKYEYIGVDISDYTLSKVQVDSAYEKLVVRDIMEGIPVSSNWADVVFCLELIEHLKTPVCAFEEMSRVMKPTAVAVVSTPYPYYWSTVMDNIFKIKGNEGHFQCFLWREICAMCEFSGLEVYKTTNTFDAFPPMRVAKQLIIRGFLGFNSITRQYLIRKKI